MTNEQLLITLKAVADADLSPSEAMEHIYEQRDQIPLRNIIIDRAISGLTADNRRAFFLGFFHQFFIHD